MSDNGGSHGFNPNNGDSDSQNGDMKVCRDFMRNVCQRKQCKFIHPENIKIRTEPIFCHDYQQNKCFRSTCKFIHCSREDEDHYKQTGELPEGASGTEYYEARPVRGKSNSGGRKPNSRLSSGGTRGGGGRNGYSGRRSNDMDGDSDIPVCKDNLKGLCDRPRGGCRFRHVEPSSYSSSRRRGLQNYYEAGPESKRNHYSSDYGADYTDFSGAQSPPPPPPPPQSSYPTSSYATYDPSSSGSHVHQGLQNQTTSSSTASLFVGGTERSTGANRTNNGYVAQSQLSDMSTALTSFMTPTSNAAAMKALEDENFMLKRRIEELKKQVSDLVATNEYLLSQNAHFRINNMAKEVQGVSGTAGVVQTLVSIAQPMGTLNPSLSVSATQPMSTITSMSIPTVSSHSHVAAANCKILTPVSISQAGVPIVSMAQPQHPSQTSQTMMSQPQVTLESFIH